MEPWPPVTILLVTYDRPAEIRKTIQALDARLQYKGPLLWHLADDGSPPGYVEAIVAEFPGLNFSHSITKRKGWGSNVNTALRACQTDFILLWEDDYVLLRDIDLSPAVALLETENSIGLIRFGHPAFGGLSVRQIETPLMGKVDYYMLDRAGPTRHIYSHRPHIKHRRFHEVCGLYAEGLPLKQTEKEFEIRFSRLRGPPEIAILASDQGYKQTFSHIGISRQGTKEDVSRVVVKEEPQVKKRDVVKEKPQVRKAPQPSLRSRRAPPRRPPSRERDDDDRVRRRRP